MVAEAMLIAHRAVSTLLAVDDADVEAELRRVCGHEDCLGREAVKDALARFLPGRSTWVATVATKPDASKELVVYAVADGLVYELSAPCSPRSSPLNAGESAVCVCRPVRQAAGASVVCEVERTGRVGASSKTITTRKYVFSPQHEVTIVTGPEDDPAQADGFARAVIAEVIGPSWLQHPHM